MASKRKLAKKVSTVRAGSQVKKALVRPTKKKATTPVAKKTLSKKSPAANRPVAPTKTAKAAAAGPAKKTRASASRDAPVAKAIAKAGDSRAPETASLVGRSAPTFVLSDQTGKVVTSATLKGRPYVLYFYPKDNTPGCTKESCDFRDNLGNFSRGGVTVFGVSPDSEKSHAGFAQKFDLPFQLLADTDKVLAQAYGVWQIKKNYGREYWGIVRSTFLIGADGKVKKEWRSVKVNGHAEAVLGAALG